MSSPKLVAFEDVVFRILRQRSARQSHERTFEDLFRDIGFSNDPDRLELCIADRPRIGHHPTPPRLSKTIRNDARPARPQPFTLGARIGVVRFGEAAGATGLGRREEARGVAEVGDGEGEEGRGVVRMGVGEVERVQERDGRGRTAALLLHLGVGADVAIGLRHTLTNQQSAAAPVGFCERRGPDYLTLRKARTARSSSAIPFQSEYSGLSLRNRSSGPPRYRFRYPPNERYSSMMAGISSTCEASISEASESRRYRETRSPPCLPERGGLEDELLRL